jgi:hypothetical protein
MIRPRIAALLIIGILLWAARAWQGGQHMSSVAGRVVHCYETIRFVYNLERQFKKSGERSGAYVLQCNRVSQERFVAAYFVGVRSGR